MVASRSTVRPNWGKITGIVVLAVFTSLWIYGLWHYWWQNWGEESLILSVLVTFWWPFVVVYYGPIFILLTSNRIGLTGAVLWAILPMWPYVYYVWYQNVWYMVDPAWRYVALAWYPLLAVTMMVVATPSRARRAVSRSGKFINSYFKIIMGVALILGAIFIVRGVLFTDTSLVMIGLSVPAILLAGNWIRTLLIGLDYADVGFVPGQVLVITHFDGTIAAPQHIHPMGITSVAMNRARARVYVNPLFEKLPGAAIFLWHIFRVILLIFNVWIVLSGLALRVEDSTFPLIPFELSRLVIAVIFTITFFLIAFGSKRVRPLMIIITAPIWSIAVLWSIAVFTGSFAWLFLWPSTLVPYAVYYFAMWTRTIYGFTENRIFVTTCYFHWWGVSAKKPSARVEAFNQDTLGINRFFFWKFGSFDPALLNLGAEEKILAEHVPHPEKLEYALEYVQGRLGRG